MARKGAGVNKKYTGVGCHVTPLCRHSPPLQIALGIFWGQQLVVRSWLGARPFNSSLAMGGKSGRYKPGSRKDRTKETQARATRLVRHICQKMEQQKATTDYLMQTQREKINEKHLCCISQGCQACNIKSRRQTATCISLSRGVSIYVQHPNVFLSPRY